MVQKVEKVQYLSLFQTKDILKLENRAPDIYQRELLIEGNSVLSTVYYKSGTGTVNVRYYEVTMDGEGGERLNLLPVHEPLSSQGHDKRIIPSIHNHIFVEAEVTGGDAEFLVYTTVVSSFASNADASLVSDGQAYRPSVDLGSPLACLNRDTGEWSLVSCDGDGLKVTGSLSVTPATTPHHDTVVLVNTATQYTWNVPNDAERITFQNRGIGTVKFSYQAGGIDAGNYFTLFPGQVYNELGIDTTNATIEFQGSKNSETLEILYWS